MKARRRDEAGATLVLVLAFLVLIGVVGSAMLSSVTSGLNGRQTLDSVRDREYAADGAIESAIAQVRDRMTGGGSATSPCVGGFSPVALNGIQIQVDDCHYVPTLTTDGYLQRNVVFAAHCATVQSKCPNTDPIIVAQVNFESPSGIGLSPIDVTRTLVQSWRVEQ